MIQGTQFEEKEGLLNSIRTKIFKNFKFLVSAEKIQHALNDMVETLWGRFDKITLVVNDDNLADYLVLEDMVGWNANYLVIPKNVHTLSIETTDTLELRGIRMPGVANGKELNVLGNVNLWQHNGTNLKGGEISRYYYSYRGSGSMPVRAIEAFETFMYWNDIWYYNAY